MTAGSAVWAADRRRSVCQTLGARAMQHPRRLATSSAAVAPRLLMRLTECHIQPGILRVATVALVVKLEQEVTAELVCQARLEVKG
jgi:hypothetical protein